jgi:excisionase family DNA binding protein
MLLTIRDLTKQLQVKSSTLYAWVAQGKIPSLKINGLIRFDPHAIDRWMKSSVFMVAEHDLFTPANRAPQDIDTVIARAKRAVYTPGCGRPDQDRAKPKEVTDGSV